MRGFTDIHSHFLYGMDDGAHSRFEMETMLDAANADGISSLVATPHATPGVYPLDSALLMQRLNEARSYCRAMGYRMNIYGGAEILYTPALRNYLVNHRLPTLGDSDYVLMEFVPDVAFREVEFAIEVLQRHGYDIILAHIERYNCFFRGRTLEKLKEQYNVHYQINANSILSKQSFFRARRIHSWLESNQIDFMASDAHDMRNRPFRMRAAHIALMEKYGRNYADELVGIYANEWPNVISKKQNHMIRL